MQNSFKEAKRRLQICSIRIIDTHILQEMKMTVNSGYEQLTLGLQNPFENMIEGNSRDELMNTTPTKSV